MRERSHGQRSLVSYFLFGVGMLCAAKIIWGYQYALWLLSSALALITPFICGFALAYILNIPCSWMQRRLGSSRYTIVQKTKRPVSIVATYALLLLLVILVLRLIIPAVSSSVSVFTQNFTVYYSNAEALIEMINDWELIPIKLSMDSLVESLKRFGLENLSQSLAMSLEAISSVFSVVFTLFLAFVSSIYTLLEKERFKAFASDALRAFSSPVVCAAILRYAGSLNRKFRQYIYCQTIDGCILGTLATIELFLIGSPYFLLLGIMLGVVNYIPYFGSIIGSLVAVVVVGFTQGLTMGAVTAVVLLVTQQIDGNFIQPKLMGGSFSLSPLLIIISITLGGSLAGPLGMIAAIPVVAVFKEMLDDLIAFQKTRKGGVPCVPLEAEAPAKDSMQDI